jgi:hypothetical protein
MVTVGGSEHKEAGTVAHLNIWGWWPSLLAYVLATDAKINKAINAEPKCKGGTCAVWPLARTG